jgi:peroxiredoxin
MLAAIHGLLADAPTALAGKFNPTRNIGDVAPDFKDLPGTDGKPHSLSEFADRDALVVVFTCNSCPTAVDYEARLIELTEKLGASGKAAVIAINANQVADDQLPKMKERADARKFNFAYVRDDSQQIAKAYGATVTPEFFVLDKNRRIVYMGALDDSTDPAGVKTRYVEEAVAAVLAGKAPAVSETVGRGCLVRYARERRKK